MFGAEISFRQEDINKSFCKPTLHVTYNLIANKLASVKAFAKSLVAPKLAFAPIAA